MKSNVAVALSVAGVLVAGTAAALVNTEVLSGSASESEPTTAEIVLSPSADPAAPVVVDDIAANGASSATKTIGERAPAPTPPSGTEAVYEIGTSGTVTLDSAGGVLRVVELQPAAGWTVQANEQLSDQRIRVTFSNGSIEVDFDADLVLGVVGTSVASRDVSVPAAALPSSGGGDDDRDEGEYEYEDDDHDEDESDDHDDDEYEDEDDD